MQVTIEFMGNQQIITKTDSIDMPIMERTTVNDALKYIRQRYPDLPLSRETIIITVNKEIASLDGILKNHDTVSFIPPISGG